MKGNAAGHVWQHSPCNGATLVVRLTVADMASDANGGGLWTTEKNLAKKVLCAIRAVSRGDERAIRDGYLQLLPRSSARGRLQAFRLLMSGDAASCSQETMSSGSSSEDWAAAESLARDVAGMPYVA
jgi:hypothetical protein